MHLRKPVSQRVEAQIHRESLLGKLLHGSYRGQVTMSNITASLYSSLLRCRALSCKSTRDLDTTDYPTRIAWLSLFSPRPPHNPLDNTLHKS